MITAGFNGSDTSTVNALTAASPRILSAIRLAMDRQLRRLQIHIVADKLEGQVLHQRTGKLIQSIRIIEPTMEGGSLQGAVEGAGGLAWYGRIHEFGGTFLRHSTMRSGIFGGRRRSLLQRRTGTYVTYPQRSFMGSAFDDLEQSMTEEMQAAVNVAAQEGNAPSATV